MVSPRSAQVDEQTPPYTARMLREDPLAYFDFNDLPAPRRTAGALDTQGREDAALVGGEPVAVGIPTGDALGQLALSVMVRPMGEEVSRAEVLRYEVGGEVVMRWSVGTGGVRLEVGGQTHEADFEINPDDWNQLGVRITAGEVELTHQGRWTRRFELDSPFVFSAGGRWSMRCRKWACDELGVHDLPVHHTVWWQALNRLSISEDLSSSPILQLHHIAGHTNVVSSVAWSPDSRKIVTGSFDNTAKLWDAETGKMLHSLEGHTEAVTSVAWSPDGKTIVTGSADDTAKVWDVDTGKLLHSLEGHRFDVESVSFSPGGGTLVTGSRDYTSNVWDLGTGKLIHSPGYHDYIAFEVVWSPDGRTLVTSSKDGTANLLNAGTGKVVYSLEEHVTSVAWSPDGRTLLAGCADGTAKLWDVGTGKMLRSLDGHERYVKSVAWSPNGRTLVTGSGDETVKVWDASTGKVLHSLEGQTSNVESVAYSPDSRMILTNHEDETAKVWDVGTGKSVQSLEGHTKYIYSAAWSPDGRTIVTGSGDKTAKVWDVFEGKVLHSLEGHDIWVATVAWSPDGRTFITRFFHQDSNALDDAVKVWDPDTGKLLELLDGKVNIVETSHSSDGRTFVTGPEDKASRFWDVDTGLMFYSIEGHNFPVLSVAWNPDGRTLVMGSRDGTACTWSVPSPEDEPSASWADEPIACLNTILEVWSTPSGFFMGPEDLDLDALSGSYGATPLSLAQLAPLYNRPHEVLGRLGYENESHLEALRQQWLRRLELLGLEPDSVTGRAEVEPPRVLVAAEADEAGNAKVSLRAADRIGLVSYQVRVDGVPVLAGGRRRVSGRRHQATHTIPLTDGANLIEVSALSTRGVESQRVSVTLEHTDATRPSLYFVGLGVSEYANPGVSDLRYAHQDVLDVADKLGAMHEASGYGSYHRLVPDEEELSHGVLEQVRAFLSRAHERDTVIVMVSGHGTYSREAAPRYFFVAHDTDPDRLVDTGIALEDLEAVLSTTRARGRLMWMDTCASGDLADETLARVVAAGGARSKGMRARAFRPVVTAAAAGSAPERRAREWVYQRGFIHRDLANRTGATVLSSSRGFELSWERDSWRNGAFTEALLEALSGAGDADSDGEVSLAELDAFVRARTAELTGGKQHPAVDRENPYLRLGFSAPTSSAPAR